MKITNEQLITQLKTEFLTSNEKRRIVENIIIKNKGLVISIAKKHNRGGHFDDLIQQGYEGILIAIENYSIEKINEVKFSTYATFWVVKKIQEYAAQNISLIVLSNYKRYSKLKRLIKEKNLVTREEIEAECKNVQITYDLYIEIKTHENGQDSLSRMVNESQTLEDTIESESYNFDLGIGKEKLAEFGATLTDCEMCILDAITTGNDTELLKLSNNNNAIVNEKKIILLERILDFFGIVTCDELDKLFEDETNSIQHSLF